MRVRVVLAVVLFFAAGCAGAPLREEAVVPASGEAVVELRAESYAFAPSRLAVPAGKTVVLRIRNEASVIPHSFVLEDPKGNTLVRENLAKKGETLVRIPPLAEGVYSFYCDESFLGKSHRSRGMEGKLEATGGK